VAFRTGNSHRLVKIDARERLPQVLAVSLTLLVGVRRRLRTVVRGAPPGPSAAAGFIFQDCRLCNVDDGHQLMAVLVTLIGMIPFGEPGQYGPSRGHSLVPGSAHNSRSSSLRPKTVPVDKGPIDLKTEAGSIAKVQVTIAEHRVLAKEAIRQRIGLRPTM
jgi:hypothetical protein